MLNDHYLQPCIFFTMRGSTVKLYFFGQHILSIILSLREIFKFDNLDTFSAYWYGIAVSLFSGWV